MRRRVVSAVIRRGAAVLLARRSAGAAFAGCWECPGGKVHEGETDAAALERECMEELGVRVKVHGDYHVGQVELDPPQVSERMLVTFYSAVILHGEPEPRPLAADELRWLEVAEMRRLQLLPANEALLPEVAYHLLRSVSPEIWRAAEVDAEERLEAERRQRAELQQRYDAREAQVLRWRRVQELIRDEGGPADEVRALEWLEERLGR